MKPSNLSLLNVRGVPVLVLHGGRTAPKRKAPKAQKLAMGSVGVRIKPLVRVMPVLVVVRGHRPGRFRIGYLRRFQSLGVFPEQSEVQPASHHQGQS